ncbi:hypothetical protein K1719_025900 [Acacia pycnantha]|nr:hypothetical protein K1719_044772 [Acacia pycnantha]KAI9096721.1 hypothetical protein K1719_025900 [Acacia pycnantha]
MHACRNNANHRRCVLARLVQGVYVHEHDCRMNRSGPKSLALPWWHFFHFHLIETLHDTSNNSVIGAVHQLTSKSGHVNIINSPKYVTAFRGIITTALSPPLYKDTLLCLRSSSITAPASATPSAEFNTGLPYGSPSLLRRRREHGVVRVTSPFLPFPSALLDRTTTSNNPKLRQGIHITTSVVKAGVSIYLQSQQKKKNLEKEDQFSGLSDWVPCFFLNPGDPVCCGYIGYFDKRLKMKQLGAEALEDVATKFTLESFIMSNLFDVRSEPRHLIPSAELIINQVHSPCFKVAHGIQQWWDRNLRSHPVMYRYK